MVLHRRIATLLTVSGALVAAVSCSKGGTTPTPIRTMAKVAGDSQVSAAGAALATSLSVQVKDQNGTPLSGVVVSWAASSGGGTVAAPSSSTDGTGTATMSRTLGPAAGYQTTTASLSGATGSPITFTSISQVQGAFSITAGTGSGQTDTVLSTLASPFQVLVTNYAGAPVAGVIVGFAVTSGGGSMSQSADTTDGSGHATASLILPSSVGPKSVQASVTGLSGSPVSFSATATAGHAAAMSIGTGNSQAAFRNTTLPSPHTVVIHDAYGNPVGGFTVHWVAGTGGGSVSDTAPASGADGIAATVRTLGDSSGTQTDTARATLTGSPVTFTSTATVPPMTAGITVGPNIAFAPTSVTIAVGGTVTWTWAAGSISHSVAFLTAPGTLPTGSSIMTAGTFAVTFNEKGTYTYDCGVHGLAMQGTIIVL